MNRLFAPPPSFTPSFVSSKTLNERERDKREALNPPPPIDRLNFMYSIKV